MPSVRSEKRRKQINESSRRCKRKKKLLYESLRLEREDKLRRLEDLVSDIRLFDPHYSPEKFTPQPYTEDCSLKRHEKREKREAAESEQVKKQRKLQQNRLANKRKNSRAKIDKKNLDDEIIHLSYQIRQAEQFLERRSSDTFELNHLWPLGLAEGVFDLLCQSEDSLVYSSASDSYDENLWASLA